MQTPMFLCGIHKALTAIGLQSLALSADAPSDSLGMSLWYLSTLLGGQKLELSERWFPTESRTVGAGQVRSGQGSQRRSGIWERSGQQVNAWSWSSQD